MVSWRVVGTLQATDYWQEFAEPLASNVIRVTFIGSLPDGISSIRGFLRLRSSASDFSSRWWRLYPKRVESELYTLRFDLPGSPDEPIKLQIRKWGGTARSDAADWAIKVDQLESVSPPPSAVEFIFGQNQGLTRFGNEDTTFT